MVTTTVHTGHPSPSPTRTTALMATSRRIEGSAAVSPGCTMIDAAAHGSATGRPNGDWWVR
jgi:hypothetical protein